jgi:acyl-CoA reductase-like NAD-dependent aldehyde dehydrogenase
MFVRTMETLAGGEWAGAETWVDVFDPVDVRQPVVRVPALTAAQVAAICDAAESGFAVWKRTPALERAQILAKAASFGQAGRRCTATSRVLVERGVHDAFVAELRARVTALRLGPGQDAGTVVGSLVSRGRQDSVLGDIATAVKQGARVELGGDAPAGDLAHGWYGGFRDSGSAFKEQGVEALHFYTRVKTVAIHFGR